MSNCKFPNYDFTFSYSDILNNQIKELQKEISELKKQLNKKTAPPKGTAVREPKTGQLGYSTGKICNAGCLPVYLFDGQNYEHHFDAWEEVEVKVKNANT